MCAPGLFSLLIALLAKPNTLATTPQSTQPGGPGVIPGWVYETGYVVHNPTGVSSGTDGSVMLYRVRSDGVAEFTFVEGNSMWVRCANAPQYTKDTTTRGSLIRSKSYCNIDDPIEFSRMLLSDELVSQYLNGKPRHFPFLTGYGWTTGPTGTRGARLEEAQLIAQSLGLNLRIAGGATVGRVSRQISPPGDLTGQNLDLEVELDGVAVKGDPPGLSPLAPEPITDDDRDGYVELLSFITPGLEGLPHFWKLPKLPPGTRMRVGTPIISSETTITISAGESNVVATVRSRWPIAEFYLPAEPVLISGKVSDTAARTIHLIVAWDAAFVERAAPIQKEEPGK